MFSKAIAEKGKFIILLDNNNGIQEIYKVFDSVDQAHEYCSARIPHRKNNKIDIYITTGNPVTYIDGMKYRDDIKPYQQHHIGVNW